MKITETRGDYFYSGLFENVIQLANYNGEVYVKNLILRDSYISGDRAGSIIGYLASNNHSNAQCSIQNCASINNYIDGNESTGGVVNNLFDSVVRSCYNTSIVVCTYYSANPIMDLPNGIGVAGGITAGCIDESSIINCYNTGDITASGCYAGGIVGGCSAYHITNCYNVGLINGKENYIGEIAGHAEFSVIKNCYYLSDRIDIGDKGEFDEEYGEICETIEISESDLKLSSVIEKLNQNGYSEYKQDIKGINNGYPILLWQ